jgi:hypothetical protein
MGVIPIVNENDTLAVSVRAPTLFYIVDRLTIFRGN